MIIVLSPELSLHIFWNVNWILREISCQNKAQSVALNCLMDSKKLRLLKEWKTRLRKQTAAMLESALVYILKSIIWKKKFFLLSRTLLVTPVSVLRIKDISKAMQSPQ